MSLIKKDCYNPFHLFYREVFLLGLVFALAGCGVKMNNPISALASALGIKGTISSFDVPASSLKGGSSVTIPFSLSISDGSSASQVKLQYAADGSNFTDVDMTMDSSATSLTWAVPKVDVQGARLKLVVVTSANKESNETSSAFSIDSTAPSSPQVTSASSNPTHSTSVLFSVSDCTDIAYVYASQSANALSDPSSAIALSTQASDGWIACSTAAGAIPFTLSSGDGNKTVYFWAKDAAGNISKTSSNAVVRLDTSVPTATITSPSAGTYISHSNYSAFPMSGSCSAQGGEVKVSLTDGLKTVSASTTCNTNASPNWSVTVDSSVLADTSTSGITATLIHTNAAGTSSVPVSLVLNKTTAFPTVAITSPLSGGYSNNANNTSYTVSGTCSANGRTVSVSASDGTTTLTASPTCNTSSSPQWSTSLDLSTLNTGTITLNASHSDAGGNTANATAVTITKDLTNPNNASSPNWVESSPSTSNTVTASWTKSNSADLGSQSLQFYSDGTCTSASGAPVSAALASTQSFTGTSGTWSYKVISYDSAGNSNTSACSTSIVLKEASLANSSLAVSSSSILKGQLSTLTLIIKDPSGVQNTTGGYTVTFSASTGAGVSAGTISSTTDNGNGTYTATFTGTAKGTATTISASVSGVGTVTQTQNITVGNTAPVITPLATSTYPVNNSNAPVIQGNSVTLATASDADSDTITLSCTYQTLGLNASDPNYAGAGTNCNSLDTITTAGSPATVITSKMASSATGSLTWTPTLTQRGTYQFTINATDGTASATAQTVTVAVRAGYTSTNLLSALDALNATNASGLSSSTPSAPFTAAAAAGSWLNLNSSSSNGSLTFGTANPWGGTGQSSTSTVDPYALTFNSVNSDSLSLGTALNTATQFSTETWVKPSPLPSASPAPIIVGNGGGTGNGFVLRQSQITPDRAEFVVGQKYYSYRDLVLSDKPVGYWRLGETSGTAATDLSAYGNNGTYSGTYSQGKLGPIAGDSNRATQFTGTNTSSVSMANSSVADFTTGDFSIELWMKPTGYNGWVLSKISGTGYGIYLNTNGTISCSAYISGTGWVAGAHNSTDIVDGNWHHLICSRSGNTMSGYLDGSLLIPSSNALVASSLSNAASLSIGLFGGFAGYGPITISDVSIYNYLLSSTQVTEHYQTGLNGNYKSYPGNALLADKPVGYWRLGEKSGGIANDSSGNGNNGPLLGGVTLNQTGVLTNTGDLDSSATFDGSTGYIEVPYNANLNSSIFSAEVWAKVTGGVSTWRSPLAQRNSTGAGPYASGFNFYASNSNVWASWIGDGVTAAGPGWKTINGPAVVLNTWTHLLVTYDGTKQNFYVNGSLVGTNTTVYAPNTARPLRIGAGATEVSPQYWFPGSVDEVAVYNYALSPTQISAHYNAGLGAGWWTCQSQTQLSPSNWNLLSTLYDGTTSKLFVNGQQECSVTPNTAYSGSVANTIVGSNSGRTSNFWQGILSAVKIFGTSNATAPATSTTIKTNFDSEVNRYRSTPIENIVTSGLVFHIDAANAKQGTTSFSNGCATTDLNWFNLSNNSGNGTLKSFASCGAASGWVGTGSSSNPNALAFDATATNYVEFPSNSNLAMTGDLTLEAWIYPLDSAWSLGMIGKTFNNFPAPYDWYLNANSANGIAIFMRGDGSNYAGFNSNATIPSGAWSHVVVTMNGTAVTHYKNGNANGSGTISTSIADAGRTLRIGSRDNLGTKFNGSMNIVRIYNRALTQQEIKQNCLAQEKRFTNTAQSICAAP